MKLFEAWFRKNAVKQFNLQRAANSSVPPALQEDVRILMKNRKRIQAIRELRLAMGCSFADARDVAWAIHYGMMADQGDSAPQQED
jgi:hypothetical protein